MDNDTNIKDNENIKDSISSDNVNNSDIIENDEDIDYSQIEPPKDINLAKIGIVLALIAFVLIICVTVYNSGAINKLEKSIYESFGKNIDINKDDMDGQSWSEYEKYLDSLTVQNIDNGTNKKTIDNFKVSVRESSKIPDHIEGYN